VPAGGVFVPYAYSDVELNRVGVIPGGSDRLQVRKVAAMAAV
jgi:hypothetical protein